MTNPKNVWIIVALGVPLIGACASPTGYSDAEHHVNIREEARNLDCADDKTPSCIERFGKPTKCFCASKDALETILEDPLYDER